MVPATITDALSMRSLAPYDSLAHRGAALAALIWPAVTILTSMFLHGSVWHLVGNMLYLFIFAAAVEYRMGAQRDPAFYLASGIAAPLATVLIAPPSRVPALRRSRPHPGVLAPHSTSPPPPPLLPS